VQESEFDNPIVFILGAGFCVDAASEAGIPVINNRPVSYPLVSELLKLCFNLTSLPPNKSIEDLFQESIDNKEIKPRENLIYSLMEADYFLTPKLQKGGSHEKNVYMYFLDRFSKAPIITFNYDSLLEILMYSKKLWRPDDGYGVQVNASLGFGSDKFASTLPQSSNRLILHLHGTLCVYESDFSVEYPQESKEGRIRLRKKPLFRFDPDSITHCFSPYEGFPPDEAFRYPYERVIAPIPNKVTGLRNGFIKRSYRSAIELIRKAKQIIVIGYSFNSNDHASYAPLFDDITNCEVLVISPHAEALIDRMNREYANIKWCGKNCSFKDWVINGFPGVY
jgi:hypothetical protein